MSFLAPFFLAGLAALAIPVLIHLIQRERKNIVHFPSLMFVRRIPYSSIRRRRIHNWALLLLRLAALALIVAAFARPFLKSTSLAAAGRRRARRHHPARPLLQHGPRRSVGSRASARRSMRSTNWLTAIAARSCCSRPAPRSRCSRRTTRDGCGPKSTPRQLSAGATRFGPALKLAGSLLAGSNLPRREVILVSDFQRSGWSPTDGLRLPTGTVLTPVTVQAEAAKNLAVTPVTIQRDQASGQDRVTVTAGVLNRSGEAVTDVPVALELDGHVAQSARVTVQAQRIGLDDLPAVHLELAEYARRGPHRRRRARARQRVLLRAVAAEAGGGDRSWAARARRATRRSISRARWPSATTRDSRSRRGPSTT